MGKRESTERMRSEGKQSQSVLGWLRSEGNPWLSWNGGSRRWRTWCQHTVLTNNFLNAVCIHIA